MQYGNEFFLPGGGSNIGAVQIRQREIEDAKEHLKEDAKEAASNVLEILIISISSFLFLVFSSIAATSDQFIFGQPMVRLCKRCIVLFTPGHWRVCMETSVKPTKKTRGDVWASKGEVYSTKRIVISHQVKSQWRRRVSNLELRFYFA